MYTEIQFIILLTPIIFYVFDILSAFCVLSIQSTFTYPNCGFKINVIYMTQKFDKNIEHDIFCFTSLW